MADFKVISPYTPSIDQQRAIDELYHSIQNGNKFQTLLGVTGSGKTFTMAKVIEKVGKPALVLTHNKTLAAQLYREFKDFFPENAVEYFVSYYDYYQPEAYVVSQDLYIEKDSSINDEIDRLRLMATSSLLDRKDVIVISSVSCIYGIGSPSTYEKMHIYLQVGEEINRDRLIKRLVDIQYSRNDISFTRGNFRVRGDVIEIFPAYREDALRVELFGDEIESIQRLHPLTGKPFKSLQYTHIYPAKHYVTEPESIEETARLIEQELDERLAFFRSKNRELEAQRLESRTKYDIEMLREMGYCSGIENYSRIIARKSPGDRPDTLIDYFKKNFLLLVDESHVSLPQVRGMYNGDRARKMNLVEYGFRLPCALDNRPLRFEEFEELIDQALFVSATPAIYEHDHSQFTAEQITRPTGLLDPEIEIRPAQNQVDDLISEAKKRIDKKERVLVTTLTKKMAEDLTRYLQDAGINCKYLHSEIETIERVEIIRDLRLGEFDVLVGINLLREGLDIPEVSLVAILDADKEGFLRSERSLIQTAGRAARNENGKVIFYADKITGSMQIAMDETKRRRIIQEQFNRDNNITPKSISKAVYDLIEREYSTVDLETTAVADFKAKYRSQRSSELFELVEELRTNMLEAAENLDFEQAAQLRDKMSATQKKAELLKKSGK